MTPQHKPLEDYMGETGTMWIVPYAWKKNGNKVTCAWCDKDQAEILDPDDHISAHDFSQKETEKRVREETLRECIEASRGLAGKEAMESVAIKVMKLLTPHKEEA